MCAPQLCGFDYNTLGGNARVLLLVFFSVLCVLSIVVYILYMVCDLFEVGKLSL